MRLTILLALAITAFAVGCGGDNGDAEGDGTAAAPRPSKAEFIAKASAACKKERADLGEETRELFARERGEPRAVVFTLWAQDVLAPTVEAEIFRMQELGIPPGELPAVEAMLDAQRLAVDRIATAERIPSMAAARRYFVEADFQYEAFGLLACASGPKGG